MAASVGRGSHQPHQFVSQSPLPGGDQDGYQFVPAKLCGCGMARFPAMAVIRTHLYGRYAWRCEDRDRLRLECPHRGTHNSVCKACRNKRYRRRTGDVQCKRNGRRMQLRRHNDEALVLLVQVPEREPLRRPSEDEIPSVDSTRDRGKRFALAHRPARLWGIVKLT